MALHGFTALPFWLALAGVALAAVHVPGASPDLPAKVARAFARRSTRCSRTSTTSTSSTRSAASPAARARSAAACGRAATQRSIDGVVVNGSARVVGWFAGVVRRMQSGYLYHYAFAMILGLIVLLDVL